MHENPGSPRPAALMRDSSLQEALPAPQPAVAALTQPISSRLVPAEDDAPGCMPAVASAGAAIISRLQQPKAATLTQRDGGTSAATQHTVLTSDPQLKGTCLVLAVRIAFVNIIALA